MARLLKWIIQRPRRKKKSLNLLGPEPSKIIGCHPERSEGSAFHGTTGRFCSYYGVTRLENKMATAQVANMQETEPIAPPETCMIATEDLWKTYDMGSEQQVQALRGVNVKIER